MTLEEGERRVYMLLDEYSSGGALTRDADIEAKMADFFDIAQKQAADIRKTTNCGSTGPVIICGRSIGSCRPRPASLSTGNP